MMACGMQWLGDNPMLSSYQSKGPALPECPRCEQPGVHADADACLKALRTAVAPLRAWMARLGVAVPTPAEITRLRAVPSE